MAEEHITPPEFLEFEKLFRDEDISDQDSIVEILSVFFSDDRVFVTTESSDEGYRRWEFLHRLSKAYEEKMRERLFHFLSGDQFQAFKYNWEDKIQPFLYNLADIEEPIIQLLSDHLSHARRVKFMLVVLSFMAYNVHEVRAKSGLRDMYNELGKLGCNIISLIKKVHPQVYERHDLESEKYIKVVTSMLSCFFACLQHAYRLGQQVKSHQNLLDCTDSFSRESLAWLIDKHEKPKVQESWFTDPEPVGLGIEVLEEVTKLVDIEGDTKFSEVNINGQRGMGKSTLAKSVIKHMCRTSSSSTEKKSSTPFSCFVHLDFGNREFSKEHIARMQENMVKQILGVDIYVRHPKKDGKRNVQWILRNISSPSFVLVFLDNVRECPQVDPLIGDIDPKSVPSKLRFIVTSQEPIRTIGRIIRRITRYAMDKLDIGQSVRLLKKALLGKESETETETQNGHSESETRELFGGEKRAMERVAELCDGIPGVIVSIAHHLKSNRTANAYGDVVQSLKKAEMSRFKCHYASDLSLSDIILSVYNLLPQDLKLVFEDVCLLFYEWDWDMLQCIYYRATIRATIKSIYDWTLIKKGEDGRVAIHNKLLKSLIVNKVQNEEERRHVVVDVVSVHKSTSLNLAESYKGFNRMEGLFLKRRIHPIMDIMPSLDPLSGSLRLLHAESGVKIKFDSQTTVFNHLNYLNSESPLTSRMFPQLRVLSTSKSIFQDFNSLSNLEWLELDSVISMCDFPRCLLALSSLRVLRLLNCNSLTSMTFNSENLGRLGKIHIISCRNLKNISFDIPYSTSYHSWLKEIKIVNCGSLITLGGNFWDLELLTSLEINMCENLIFYKSSRISNDSIQKIRLEKVNDIKFLNRYLSLPSLVELHLSSIANMGGLFVAVKDLNKLQILSIKDCNEIQTILGHGLGRFISLEELSISSCEKLENLLEHVDYLDSLKKMAITSCTNLTCLPKTLEYLQTLEILDLSFCKEIKQLDFSHSFKQLKKLILISCWSLETLPIGFQGLTSLEELDMSRCDAIKKLPDVSGAFPSLKLWKLCSCKKLESLPSNLQNLTSLKMIDLRDCKHLDKLTLPTSLEVLNMSSSNNLPQNLDTLEFLKDLDLSSSDILIKKNELKNSQYFKTAHLNTIGDIEDMLV